MIDHQSQPRTRNSDSRFPRDATRLAASSTLWVWKHYLRRLNGLVYIHVRVSPKSVHATFYPRPNYTHIQLPPTMELNEDGVSWLLEPDVREDIRVLDLVGNFVSEIVGSDPQRLLLGLSTGCLEIIRNTTQGEYKFPDNLMSQQYCFGDRNVHICTTPPDWLYFHPVPVTRDGRVVIPTHLLDAFGIGSPSATEMNWLASWSRRQDVAFETVFFFHPPPPTSASSHFRDRVLHGINLLSFHLADSVYSCGSGQGIPDGVPPDLVIVGKGIPPLITIVGLESWDELNPRYPIAQVVFEEVVALMGEWYFASSEHKGIPSYSREDIEEFFALESHELARTWAEQCLRVQTAAEYRTRVGEVEFELIITT